MSAVLVALLAIMTTPLSLYHAQDLSQRGRVLGKKFVVCGCTFVGRVFYERIVRLKPMVGRLLMPFGKKHVTHFDSYLYICTLENLAARGKFFRGIR